MPGLTARQRGGAKIDPPAFLGHVMQLVVPLLAEVHARFPERAAAVLVALYDASLDLFAAALLGPEPKVPVVLRVWTELLPNTVTLLAREPYRSRIPWDKVEIFWGDERCVPPDDAHMQRGLDRGQVGRVERKREHALPDVGTLCRQQGRDRSAERGVAGRTAQRRDPRDRAALRIGFGRIGRR